MALRASSRLVAAARRETAMPERTAAALPAAGRRCCAAGCCEVWRICWKQGRAQRARFFHGLDAQFILQHGPALFVLTQRERPMTALQVEADQLAMDVFAERIECQNLLPAPERVVVGGRCE